MMLRQCHYPSIVIKLVLLLFLSACSSANGLSAVTPIPTVTTELPEKDESSPTPEPTSRQSATATQVADEDDSNQNTTDRQTGINNFALATFTPAPNKLPPGEARAIALATDTVMTPEIEEPLTFDEAIVPIRFDEFYSGFSIRTGLKISDKLKSLDGKQVVIEGYVAPPLKPRLDFFVLTKIQLAFCPFCSTDVEWPDDIALVYLPEQQIISSEFPVRITGTLELGSNVDAETGMVSLVRIYSQTMEILN